MRVRWTTDAADDLERICNYIAEDRREAARRVAQSVLERVGWKHSRVSDAMGAFLAPVSSSLPPLPFIAVYEVLDANGAGVGVAVDLLRRRPERKVVYRSP